MPIIKREPTKRERIAAELMTLADDILAGWDSYEVLLDEPETGYIAKLKNDEEDGVPVTVMKWRCEGLTMEQWNIFMNDPTSVTVGVNPHCMTREEIPDIDDVSTENDSDIRNKCYHLKTSVPYMLSYVVSNRSTLTTYYWSP